MFPNIKINNAKQQGFAIISALFLIVVLSFLGVSMARIFTTGQQAINQETTSLQTYFAAQSAQQWGMYQAVFSTPSATPTITFSNAGLNNTTAAVTLVPTTVLSRNYYKITTQANYAATGNPEFSQRNLELRFVP